MRKVFTVKGYDVSGRSAASFKLDLRAVCKESESYFLPITSGLAKNYVKNLGQLLFGVPDKWKGIFSMTYTSDNTEKTDVKVYLDHRVSLTGYEEEMKELIREGLKKLKELKIIEAYEEVK